MYEFKKLIAKHLRELADKFDGDNSEITEADGMEILKVVAHNTLSKAQASKYLNVSPQHFDLLIRLKSVPKGRKVVGFNEKRWYQDELDVCLYKIKKEKK